MTPIYFSEHNVVYAKDQPEYQPLPAFRDPGESGAVVSCWKLSLKERIRLLFTGKLWLSLLSFHGPLQPIYPTTIKSEVITVKHKVEA